MEQLLQLPPSDEELVAKTLTDKDSFGELVDRYEAKLRRYITRLGVRDYEDQSDVLQDIFLRPTVTLMGLILSYNFPHGFIVLRTMKRSAGIVKKMYVRKVI